MIIVQNFNVARQDSCSLYERIVDAQLANYEAAKAYDAEQAASASSGPASTGAVEAAPPPMPECVSLSPDALMTYCETRLNSLDSQMQGIFDQQQKNATETTDLSAIASTLNQLPGPNSKSPPTVNITAAQINQLQAEYTQAIKDAGGQNTQLGASLAKDAATLPAAGSGDTTISADTASQLTQSLKNYTGDLNSNSEMTMINLQSLMSQRQTAVQLTTNLVQSLGEQASDIAKNIGQ